MPPRWADELTRALPRGASLRLEGGTHTLNYVNPWSLAFAIEPFLLEHARAAASAGELA
ncbi:hypothetical protein GWC77_15295 [Paraburkholderia sp. NMBU_R16]|uniref:hypothetical protein n=1 Tax=Paraburkholderia sp. NMBU_R16 TaxID=2698676 RepID=UPI001566A684|nr:hypothetical protein [Paraburkholderia sp. NMBU_R16]NRO97289.1 hypothetical protein [Paraburkholderia sp. NMBU_R16]